MKIVIVRLSVETALPDAIYEAINAESIRLNPEDSPEAVALSARFSSLLNAKCRVEQVYDSWEEAGH